MIPGFKADEQRGTGAKRKKPDPVRPHENKALKFPVAALATNNSLDAAPQTHAQFHTRNTALLHRNDAITISDPMPPASHQFWGQGAFFCALASGRFRYGPGMGIGGGGGNPGGPGGCTK